MRSRKVKTPTLVISLFISAVLLIPARVYAQELIPRETLDEWFYSRLIWGLLIGAVIGVIVALGHLCRLQFKVSQPNPLQVNNQAWKRFGIWLVVIFVVGAILLFLDAWLIYPFSAISLQFSETLTQVWLSLRMLGILGAALLMFTVAVFLATRLKSDCRCRYAFLRGPQGK
jgi:hypothetical protein